MLTLAVPEQKRNERSTLGRPFHPKAIGVFVLSVIMAPSKIKSFLALVFLKCAVSFSPNDTMVEI